MKAEMIPDEIEMSCDNESTEPAIDRRRLSKRPVPLVSAHSSISMRYDSSKPSGVTVIDPRLVSSRRDYHRKDSIRINVSEPETRDARETHAERRHEIQNTDDKLSFEAKSPTLKLKTASRRRPLPLAPVRSSISMRLSPSRTDRVLIVNPASPTYIDENNAISPLADNAGSISSVAPRGTPVELDNGSVKQRKTQEDNTSIRALSRRKVKNGSLRRPLPLGYQRSSASVQTAPSVLERAGTSKFANGWVTCHRTNRWKGYIIGLDNEPQKQHAHEEEDDECHQYQLHGRTRLHSSTAQHINKNDLVSASSDFSGEENSRFPQQDPVACSSSAPVSPREQHVPPLDETESAGIRLSKIETRDGEFNCELNSSCDESLRRILTMHSDFEVEVRVHEGYGERDVDCSDDYSMTTPDSATNESMCSSINTTASKGTKSKGLLRRIAPTKIKDKLSAHHSGARTILSAPERKLPKISEMMACDDDLHETNRSTGTTVTIHPNGLEHVTSELTDANFSEDQSVFSKCDERKESIKTRQNVAMQTVQFGKQRMELRNYREKDDGGIDDQTSVHSRRSILKQFYEVGKMLSPVTSDLSATVSESFESRRVRKSVPETNSVASKSSLFSRTMQIIRQSSNKHESGNFISARSVTNQLSEDLSEDLSTEKEDTITTVYDRNARGPYCFSTRPRVPAFEENITVSEDQPDRTVQKVNSPDTIVSSTFASNVRNPRLLTLRRAKAQFGLSFGAEDENSLSGMNRHRSERSRKAELAMLPSEDSGVLEDSFPEPSPDYLKPELDDTAVNPFLASLNSFRAHFGL